MKHTPTPWEVNPKDKLEIRDVAMESIVECYPVYHDGDIPHIEEAVANAALIVQAVNSHQALVDFVKQAKEEFEECAEDTFGTPTEQHFRALALKASALLQGVE